MIATTFNCGDRLIAQNYCKQTNKQQTEGLIEGDRLNIGLLITGSALVTQHLGKN